MKLKRLFSLAAVFFIAGNIVAQQPAHLDMMVEQPDKTSLKFAVHVTNPEQQKVTLSVTNKAEGAMAIRTFSAGNFLIVFDLNGLEDGEYTIEAKAGKRRLQKNISIETFSRVERVASVNTSKKARQLAF